MLLQERKLKKMLDRNFFQNFAVKSETSFRNIIREYTQHLFLRSFYTKRGCENFLFKGGTALKIVFGSPRFSEDLDFTGIGKSGDYEKILEEVLFDLSSEGVNINLVESKPTSGGHLANMVVSLFEEKVEIQNQISFRESGPLRPPSREAGSEVSKGGGENIVVATSLVPAYSIYLLDRAILVEEKIQALIERAKPRDFFDLYFILRKEELRKLLTIDSAQREKVLARVESQSRRNLERELKELLPRSFWRVISDLPAALKKEFA